VNVPRYRAWRFLHPDLEAPEGSAGLQLTSTRKIAMVDEDASVRQSIFLLVTTVPGERVMRPDYGCELYRLAFSPNDDTTAGLAIHYVRRALERWEPRIEILRLDAGRDELLPERLNVVLEYCVRATRRADTATFKVDLSGGTP